MGVLGQYLKSHAAALAVLAFAALPAAGQDHRLDDLFEALRGADESSYRPIEEKIWQEWSKSGSAAMDLLLERGRQALQDGDPRRAVEHLSALIDHAPDFAEGYNARATAYFNMGRYGESLDDLRMALALNPRHFGALTGLATILDELGYEAQALDVWQRVRQINPNQENLAGHIQDLERRVRGSTL